MTTARFNPLWGFGRAAALVVEGSMLAESGV